MKNSFRLSAAIIGLGAASLASASTYSCVGTIDFVSVSPTGVVAVSSPSSWLATFFVCSMSATVNGVAVDS